jgi:hypothetical protein
MAMQNSDRLAEKLRHWAELGRALTFSRPRVAASWDAVERMVRAARTAWAAESEYLRGLLSRSNRILVPLGDPLLVNFGVHRWLASEREPCYSDWLAWIVNQITDANCVLGLFRMESQVWSERPQSGPLRVDREFPIEGGILDLLIRHAGRPIGIVEVKVTSAEQADLTALPLYRDWLLAQIGALPRGHLTLLATEGKTGDYHSFGLLCWSQLCLALRRLAKRFIVQEKLVAAAMTLGFVGAVEQNLLGFSSGVAAAVFAGGLSHGTQGLARYLEEFVSREPQPPAGPD